MTKSIGKTYYHISLTKEANFIIERQSGKAWLDRLAAGARTVGVENGYKDHQAFATYDENISAAVARGVLGDSCRSSHPAWDLPF